MKKVLLITMILLSLIMISCVNNNKVPVVEQTQQDNMALSQIVGLYEIEDMTDLGVWVLSLNEKALSGKLPIRDWYVLKIDENDFELKRNPLLNQQYLVLLPEGLTTEQIAAGTVETTNSQRGFTKRLNGDVGIESVYIQKSEAENGTNLFAMTLTDYVILKKAKNTKVYENAKLLRPAYVKSSDGYVYAMKTYYDARQVASSHTVDGAFTFLKTRADHAEYLFEGEPNRVSVAQNGEVVTLAPDTRDRVRDLGTMGEVESNAYNILSEGSDMAVYVSRDRIPSKYQSSDYYDIEVKGTLYKLIETAKPGIFKVFVPQSVTTNVDLIKNARFEKSSPFSAGNGTAENPFEISNADELNAIRGDYLGTPGSGYHFKQVADIDLSSSDYDANWAPIGTDSATFCGYYDGQNFKIDNLRINEPARDCSGLFGLTDTASVVNLSLENAYAIFNMDSGFIGGKMLNSFVGNCDVSGYMDSGTRSGGVIGYTATTTVADCTASVTINTAHSNQGGVIGYSLFSTVTNCHTKILLNSERAGTNYHSFGGVVGNHNAGPVVNCSAQGYIYGNGGNSGGLVGANAGLIEDCHADVLLDKDGIGIGGFVGTNHNIIRNCYSLGDVSGTKQVGGFVGVNSFTATTSGNYSGHIDSCFSEGNVTATEESAGGFVGYVLECLPYFESHINNSYSLGNVTGPLYVGGFAGLINNHIIENCYAAGSVVSDSEWSGGFYGANLLENLPYNQQPVKEGTVTNCYWDISTTGYVGSLDIEGGEGKLTPDMKQKTTFTNWDFDGAEPVWEIVEGGDEYSYPYLVDNAPATEPGRATVSRFNGGSGTAEDPYQIALWEQLVALNEEGLRDKHFKLVANLTSKSYGYDEYVKEANAGVGWTPLGTSENPFTGTLDGNGFKIKDLIRTVYSADYQGLFGYIQDATLTNCLVEEAEVAGKHQVGILAGYNRTSQMINCSVSGKVTGGLNEPGNNIGGLVGTNDGTITNCQSSAEVGRGDELRLGGLVGANEGWILSCSASGTVFADTNVGGVVGYNSGVVRYSYSEAEIKGKRNVGGFVGCNNASDVDTMLVEQCFSAATITNNGNSLSNAGGFVGNHEGGVIQDCYSTTRFVLEDGINESDLGGFVGMHGAVQINRCYSTGYAAGFYGSGWSTYNEQNYWWSYDNRKLGYEWKNTFDSNMTSLKALYQYEMAGYISGWDYTDTWETTFEEGKWISPSLKNITAEQKPGYVDEVTFGDENADGSEEKPLLIRNKAALETIREAEYIDKGYHFIITEYLTLNDTSELYSDWETNWDNWTPVGDETTPFKGVVDGHGHSITGIKCETDGIYNGIFGVIEDTTLTNINVSYPMLTGNGISGALVGWVKSTAVVENCHLNSHISSYMIIKNGTAGGLIGKNGGTVKNASAYGWLNNPGVYYEVTLENDIFGGLIAINEGTVEQCYSHAYLRNNNTSMILGGLVAEQNGGTIKNSYFFGNLRGYDTIGGLVAKQTGGTIDKCYASAEIFESGANTKMGALIGEKTDGSANGYWESDSYTKSAAGSALTREQMKVYTSFDGWDFNDIWNSNGDYPWLRDNEQEPHPIRE